MGESQENKARQIFRKTNISYSLIRTGTKIKPRFNFSRHFRIPEKIIWWRSEVAWKKPSPHLFGQVNNENTRAMCNCSKLTIMTLKLSHKNYVYKPFSGIFMVDLQHICAWVNFQNQKQSPRFRLKIVLNASENSWKTHMMDFSFFIFIKFFRHFNCCVFVLHYCIRENLHSMPS